MEKKGFKGPTPLKTGTTICGAICKVCFPYNETSYWYSTYIFQFLSQDGVILGADTRATEGSIVADKTCLKIHPITENIQYDYNIYPYFSVILKF